MARPFLLSIILLTCQTFLIFLTQSAQSQGFTPIRTENILTLETYFYSMKAKISSTIENLELSMMNIKYYSNSFMRIFHHQTRLVKGMSLLISSIAGESTEINTGKQLFPIPCDSLNRQGKMGPTN